MSASLCPHLKIVTDPEIFSVHDIEEWFGNLLLAGINFHPEESFAQIGERLNPALPSRGTNWRRTFSDEEVARMDSAMDAAYEVIKDEGVDVCGIACNIFDKFERGEL